MRRLLLPFAAALGLGCVEPQSLSIESGAGLEFAVRLDPDGQLLEARGPYPGEENLVFPTQVAEGNSLLLVRVDDLRLAELHPRYRAEARLESTLLPVDEELEGCAALGRSVEDSKLEVALGALRLEDGTSLVQAFALGAEAERAETIEVPRSLALQIPMHPCGHGSSLEFSPFADAPHIFDLAMVEPLGSAESLSALDEDTLLFVGSHGLGIVRRGARLDLQRDRIHRSQLPLPARGEGRWFVRHAEVVSGRWPSEPATIIVALGFDEQPSGGGPGRLERLGAWVRLRLSPEGQFTMADSMILEPPELAEYAGLRFVHRDVDGRYVVVGREVVLTATASDARPEVHWRPSFSANAAYSLEGELAPHLVLLDGGQLFEGDLFALPESPKAHVLEGQFDLRLLRAARPLGIGSEWTATGSDYRLRRRERSDLWTEVKFSLPPALAACASEGESCGSRVLTTRTGPIVAAPNGDGLLFGSPGCVALLWLRAKDACVTAASPPGLAIRASMGGAGARALLVEGERVYLALGTHYLYEVRAEIE